MASIVKWVDKKIKVNVKLWSLEAEIKTKTKLRQKKLNSSQKWGNKINTYTQQKTRRKHLNAEG